jgi:hypothetical protein
MNHTHGQTCTRCEWAGGTFFTYTRCAWWAGGTFFTVVLLCQFLVLAGNRFWFYILMYLEYNTVVVLCEFFGSGGK